MNAPIDKRVLVARLRDVLGRELDVLRQAVASAREGATHEQAKPENDKDTRALEQSYLAGAQSARVRLLEAADKRLEFLDVRDLRPSDPVRLGALVEADVDGVLARYFIADAAGGTKTEVEGVEIQVVTPEAPLGQALIGRVAGDVIERNVGGKVREYEIVAVR